MPQFVAALLLRFYNTNNLNSIIIKNCCDAFLAVAAAAAVPVSVWQATNWYNDPERKFKRAQKRVSKLAEKAKLLKAKYDVKFEALRAEDTLARMALQEAKRQLPPAGAAANLNHAG